MTPHEFVFIDKKLSNISFRNIITLILCTATSVGTVLGVYYGFKTEQEILKVQIKILEERVHRLENITPTSLSA
jgi:hypothetical protein